MYRKVLIPLDGSSSAERVLTPVRALLAAEGAELILLRVVRLESSVSDLANSAADERTSALRGTSLRAEAESYLSLLREGFTRENLHVQVRVLSGDVPTVIATVAEEEKVDLIAMTTHGRSGIGRAVLGSVADKVLRMVSQPVFLVRSAAPESVATTLRRILVPLDGLSFAEQALPLAVDLAGQSGATIYLLRSLDPGRIEEHDALLGASDKSDSMSVARARSATAYLTHKRAQLEAEGVHASCLVYYMPPGGAILHAAVSEDVDLIIMSTHGRAGLDRWLFGSVAESVLNNTPRPVLLVRSIPASLAVQRETVIGTA